MATSIVFNGTSLQDSNVITRKITHENNDHRQLNIQGLGRFGAKIVDDTWNVKRISIEGTIKDSSKANLEARIDNLNKYLLGQGIIDKNLDVAYSSGTRRYPATCISFQITREYYTINCVDYKADFIVSYPFGRGLDTSTLEFNGLTTAERDSINFAGSASPMPKIKIIINSATALTGFEFQNTTTGDSVAVNTALVAGDIVIIDCDDLSVQKNGAEIDYQGTFPEFENGWNDFYIWFTGTAYDVDLRVIYYSLWI